MRYGSWDIRRYRQGFFVILGHFLPFDPPNNLNNQSFEKMTRRNHHFTLVYHKWQSYHTWLLRFGAQKTDFFLLFLPFYPLKTWKIKISKKWKKQSGHIILHFCTKNQIKGCMLPELWNVTDTILLSFWAIFALLAQ